MDDTKIKWDEHKSGSWIIETDNFRMMVGTEGYTWNCSAFANEITHGKKHRKELAVLAVRTLSEFVGRLNNDMNALKKAEMPEDTE